MTSRAHCGRICIMCGLPSCLLTRFLYRGSLQKPLPRLTCTEGFYTKIKNDVSIFGIWMRFWNCNYFYKLIFKYYVKLRFSSLEAPKEISSPKFWSFCIYRVFHKRRPLLLSSLLLKLEIQFKNRAWHFKQREWRFKRWE